MKNPTDFRKTLEAGVDPRLGCVIEIHFILFNFASYLPSIAMELKVSKEITCKCQNQRSVTNKYVF